METFVVYIPNLTTGGHLKRSKDIQNITMMNYLTNTYTEFRSNTRLSLVWSCTKDIILQLVGK